MPDLRAGLALAHGPLMVSGFLVTVISLERAMALGLVWAHAAPVLAGLGVVALLVGMAAPLLFGCAGLSLVGVFVHLLRRQRAAPMMVMAAGAGVWLGGNMLWFAGAPIFKTVPWLMGFLVLTIVGERLELSRLPRALIRSISESGLRPIASDGGSWYGEFARDRHDGGRRRSDRHGSARHHDEGRTDPAA